MASIIADIAEAVANEISDSISRRTTGSVQFCAIYFALRSGGVARTS